MTERSTQQNMMLVDDAGREPRSREVDRLQTEQRRPSELKLTKAKLSVALRRYAPVLLIYLAATALTDAYFMADTADYVDSIAARARGANYDYWEFGHLLWRPFGWLCLQVANLLFGEASGAALRVQTVWTLLVLNWLAGAVCVLSLRGLVSIIAQREWAANITTIAFIFSHGFLNFAQTGSSYVPGLALLLTGLWLLARSGERGDGSWRTAVLSGACLAGAVCCWFLYVWAIPAALLLPLILFRTNKERKRLALRAAVVFALAVGAAYAAVLLHLGITSVAGVREWVSSASHGNDTRGLLRAGFGFSRSFINMGDDGMLFKRFLLKDAFNPVSTFDLLRLSLWKIGLFYVFLSAIIAGLLRSAQGKRVLLLLCANALPVLAFAVMFDGGAVERYLPVYPALFLALGYALASARVVRWQKVTAIVFVTVAALVNVSVMAKTTLNQRQEAAAARIRDLQPLLKPGSMIFTVSWLDELVNFNRSFPLHPINRQEGVVIGSLVTPGTEQSGRWRQDFAAHALKAWANSNDVWVSQRVFAERPRADWNWAEGDDRRVSWPDFKAFFSQLEVGQQVGGEDGFVLLMPSIENKRVLERLARGEQKSK